jgi:hypothetical protein
VHPPAAPLDPSSVFSARLTWTTADFPWLRANYEGQSIFCRLNTSFPDGPLYSLLIDDDVTDDFHDFPTG